MTDVVWLESLYIAIPVALLLVMGFLRSATPNILIRKRLRISILLLAAAAILALIRMSYSVAGALLSGSGVIPGPLASYERTGNFEFLLMALAVIVAAVALVFNRFGQEAPSEKYPAIVQDTVVIGVFMAGATFWWPEKLLTTSAVGAVVLGFALQDTLGNLFAGLAIQIEKPFRLGDWIRAAEHEGLVQEVTWRATKIRNKAGNFIIIPNTLVSKDKIVNYSQPTRLMRVEQIVGLGYESHPNDAKRVILDAIADVPEALSNPAPDVLVSQYGESSIHYRCRFWIDDFGMLEPILDKFTTLLYYRLKRAGMAIPVPIRDVRLTEKPPSIPQPAGTPDGRAQFVEKIDMFENLAPAQKDMVAKSMQGETFAAGEMIIRQGAEGDSMFFIRRGKARVLLGTLDENREVAVLHEGQYFGEMTLLTGESRTATVVASRDLEAYVLRKDPFRDVLLKDPTIAMELSRVVASRKKILEEATAEMVQGAPSQKEAHETLLTRIQRFFGL